MKTYYFTTTCPIDANSNNELAESLKSEFGKDFAIGIADTPSDMWLSFGTIELDDTELKSVGMELADREYVLFDVLPTLEQCDSGEVDNMSINSSRTYYYISACPIIEQSNHELQELLYEEFGKKYNFGLCNYESNDFGTIDIPYIEFDKVAYYLSKLDSYQILLLLAPLTPEQCEMDINEIAYGYSILEDYRD